MTVTLTPHAEALLQQLSAIGVSPEQVIERALESLAQKGTLGVPQRSVAEVVEHIRSSRKGVTLGGLEIKDLIHEGHRY